MDGDKRRQNIVQCLKESSTPLSASKIARTTGVSRQIIVGDVALLRASGVNIVATNKGYVLSDSETKAKALTLVKLIHQNEDIYDELCTIVDYGGRILNIEVNHSVYGKLVCDINVSNRIQAGEYASKFENGSVNHLSSLTSGVHYHYIEANDEITLIRIQKALNDKGYLVR